MTHYHSLDILPVVVLDGQCPEAKAATVSARNKLTWGDRRPEQRHGQMQSPKRQQRRQFTGVLRDCSRLLQSLGVPVIAAPGELNNQYQSIIILFLHNPLIIS